MVWTCVGRWLRSNIKEDTILVCRNIDLPSPRGSELHQNSTWKQLVVEVMTQIMGVTTLSFEVVIQSSRGCDSKPKIWSCWNQWLIILIMTPARCVATPCPLHPNYHGCRDTKVWMLRHWSLTGEKIARAILGPNKLKSATIFKGIFVNIRS